MREKSKIPTELEFSRAKQKMVERLGNEANMRAAILANLPKRVPCHDVWVWLSDDIYIVSFIFPNDADLESHHNESQGLVKVVIKNAAEIIGVAALNIEYHSHEYALKEFNGNYDKYFR